MIIIDSVKNNVLVDGKHTGLLFPFFQNMQLLRTSGRKKISVTALENLYNLQFIISLLECCRQKKKEKSL